MPTQQTTFRLSDADREALDRIAGAWGCDRTAAVRKLIHAEAESGEAATAARADLLADLVATYGRTARLEVDLDGATVEARVDGQPLDGAEVELVFGAGGRAELAELSLRRGAAVIVLAELPAIRGEITLTFELGELAT